MTHSALHTDVDENGKQNDTTAQHQTAFVLLPQHSHQFRSAVLKTIFFVLGIGILAPWNLFINANVYFEKRLCSNQGYEELNFELWFGFIWNTASIMALGGMIICRARPTTFQRLAINGSDRTKALAGNDCRDVSQGSSYITVMASLGIYLICFLAAEILVLIPNIGVRSFGNFTLATVAICGISGAIANAGIVATAGMYSPDLGLAPFFAGQAVGGLAVSIANFGAVTSEDPSAFLDNYCSVPTEESSLYTRKLEYCEQYKEVDWGTFFFFLFGCGVLVLSIIGFHSIHGYDHSTPSEQTGYGQAELGDDGGCIDQYKLSSQARVDVETRQHEERTIESEPLEDDEHEVHDVDHSLSEVVNIVMCPALTLFGIFTVTLSIFPGWISQIHSSGTCRDGASRIFNDLYMPSIFILFTAGDLFGRVSSSKISLPTGRAGSVRLVFLAAVRILLFPIFMFCVEQHDAGDETFARHDGYLFLTVMVFSISNGFLVSWSFVHAASLIPRTPKAQELSSEILSLAVTLGLLTGSILSFPFSRMTDS